MKKYIIWLITEYKRAAHELPLTVKRAVVFMAVLLAAVGMIAFCALKIKNDEESDISLLKVGYVADDDMITNLAVSYVEDMESIKSICDIEKVGSEDEGLEMLENGELSALIVLPENVMHEIITGSNTHGTLYRPALSGQNTQSGINNVAIMLLEELASAGMGMIGTAQAEIYATDAILSQVTDSLDSETLNDMYDDIDIFNLATVTNREYLYRTRSLSLTENDTYTTYYAAAALTVYVMLSGLFIGGFCKRNRMEQVIAKRRMGISYTYQLACRYLAGYIPAAIVTVLPLMLLFIPKVGEFISIKPTYEGIIGVMLSVFFMLVFNMLVYELSENRQAAFVMTGFNIILQSYMSGCIIPKVLLPVKIAKIGEYLPASFIKASFRMLITGSKDGINTIEKGLIIWSLIIFTVTLFTLRIREEIQPKTEKRLKLRHGKYHIPSLYMVVLRRFIQKKSVWACLIIIAVASVFIVNTEKTSDTTITAAFYDESGEFEKTLEEYDGLVKFESYESEEEVKRAILKDKAECGYIIPKDLTQLMLAQMSNGAITVYKDDDAIAVPVVDEVLFEKIYKTVSLKWFENYLLKSDAVKESTVENSYIIELTDSFFDEMLEAGITFNIDLEHIGENDATDLTTVIGEQSQATYPVEAVAILIVAICAIYGIIQVASDMGKKRFYRCKKGTIYFNTVLIPVLFGIVTGVLIIAFIVNNIGNVGSIPIDFLGYK